MFLIKESSSSLASKESVLHYCNGNHEETIKKLIALGPDFISSNTYIDYDRDPKETFPHAEIIDDDFLPDNFFGKRNSFSFRIKLVESETFVRSLTDSEIERIIDEEYTSINGYYKFSDYKEDQVRSILVTKEELANYLKTKIKYAQIVFKQKVLLKNNQYLILKRK